jgi:hypothetical protein
MDIDRPLDDLIPKRKPKPRSSTGRGGGGAGVERSERRKSRGSDAPYAVSVPSLRSSSSSRLRILSLHRNY